MKRINLMIMGIMAVAVSLMAQAPAYTAVEVADGGSISGVVKIKGAVPKDPMLEVEADQEFCGEKIAAEHYVVSAAGEVKYAVAMLDGIKKGAKLTATEAFMDNAKCRNEPRVVIAPKGGTMKYKNSDPIGHTAHYYLVGNKSTVDNKIKKKSLINQATPKKDMIVKHKKPLRKAGLVSLECDPHAFEQGWVWVLEHPYGAVTDGKGAFKIENVPAGKHKVTIWHEKLGSKTMDVEVKAGADTKVNVEFAAK